MPVVARDPSVNVRSALRAFCNGSRDATTRLTANEFWRASYTPAGPATVRISWTNDTITSEAWGTGSTWMLQRVAAMCGLDDPGYQFGPDAHPLILSSQRDHPGLVFGASGTLYHELLPAILGQRVTTVEALRQWSQLCLRLGEPAPGPHPSLRLPPHPDALVGCPAWWFHPFGIESKRAQALRTVARHYDRIEQWSSLHPLEAGAKLSLLPGLGTWTIAVAGSPAFGNSDAVPVGDYHLKNMVSWAFTGRPRGTDAQMVALLQPYAGQRGRVLRLLLLAGAHAPKFGPKQRIQPMHRR